MLQKSNRIVDKKILESVRQQPCVCCNRSPSHPHHVTSRGAGGGDVVSNLMPLCVRHHTEIHKVGIGKMSWKYPVIKHWLMKHSRYDVIARMERA